MNCCPHTRGSASDGGFRWEEKLPRLPLSTFFPDFPFRVCCVLLLVVEAPPSSVMSAF